MLSLSIHEDIQFVWLSFLLHLESQSALHLVQSLVDVHEFREEVGSTVDELPRQILTNAVVESVAHVTFPQTEHFADKVVLEELHARQHIEHSRLLHPFGEGQELCGNVRLFGALDSGILVLEDLNDTLGTDCEVLLIELLGVL